MPTCVIERGLPGAGKSWDARGWVARLGADYCSADLWFEGPGGYAFRPGELGQAHEACWQAFLGALRAGRSVVVDNTHCQRWEWARYHEAAVAAGYAVVVRHLFDGGFSDEELARRNTHGVPAEAIGRMRARWEEYNPGK
jgi:predicted kinase